MPKVMLRDVADGQQVRTLAALSAKKLIPYKNKPGAFLALTLADKSGSLEGKIFDNAEEIAGRLHVGDIISIAGRGSVYNGVMGIVLDAAEPYDGSVERGEFMATSGENIPDLTARFAATLASARDPDYAALVQTIFDEPDIRARFLEAPAAKSMHGAYLHGLLEHVMRQVTLAETVCQLYPQANRDLLITGVLLHDIGKIWEYSWNLQIDLTTFGRLLGHVTIGDKLVYEYGRQLNMPDEKAMLLRHCILSHHGTREFGAPILPATLEAMLLHTLDYLEAKAEHCLEMLATGDPTGEWSDYDRIEGRTWYRGAAQLPVEAGER